CSAAGAVIPDQKRRADGQGFRRTQVWRRRRHVAQLRGRVESEPARFLHLRRRGKGHNWPQNSGPHRWPGSHFPGKGSLHLMTSRTATIARTSTLAPASERPALASERLALASERHALASEIG